MSNKESRQKCNLAARWPLVPALLLGFSSWLAGCSDSSGPHDREPLITAADIATAQSASAPVVAIDALQDGFADADRQRGAELWRQCSACHRIRAGTASGSGPTLHRLFGRAAGSLPGFPYSPALRDADFVWTPDALDAWLRSPYRFLPGNRMSFGGISRPGDRRDLIAWLIWNSAE